METGKINVSYRDIAVMLTKALIQLKGPEFNEHIDNLIEEIRKLPIEARNALRSAYIFSAKVPREDREDMFQELFIAVYEAKTKDEAFGYAIARCDWKNWWSKYYRRSAYYGGSLNETITDTEGNSCEVIDLVVGESEFEAKMYSDWEATRIFGMLPHSIQYIVNKKMIGTRLSRSESTTLTSWANKHGNELLLTEA
jgi:hypothetical protein